MEDFVDFGLGLAETLCFTDFDLKFIRECLLAGLAGVIGVAGRESVAVTVSLRDSLRGSGESTLARSRIVAIRCGIRSPTLFSSPGMLPSSVTDTTVGFSILLRVNIALNPPFDSLFPILGCFNGTRISFSSWAETSTGGGRSRRAKVNAF